MKCPRCAHSVDAGQEWCVQCGFSMEVVDEQFGHDAVFVERLTDAAGVLTEESHRRIGLALEEFGRRLPQFFLAVYIGAMPQQTSLRQFGFWLLNRAAVSDVEVTRPNENGLLLVIDMHGRTAALVCGYFVECYTTEGELSAWLGKVSPALAEGNCAEAVERICEEAVALLRRRARDAARDPGRFAPPRPPLRVTAPVFVKVHGNAPAPDQTAPHRHD